MTGAGCCSARRKDGAYKRFWLHPSGRWRIPSFNNVPDTKPQGGIGNVKKVLQQLGRYRKDTILCIIMAALEILMEILMPFITALIIDQGLEAANLNLVYRYGILMVVMALLSLVFGSLAGKCAASASASA